MRRIPFAALEVNPKQVDFVRHFDNEVYYGNASRMDTLRAAHLERARAFVLTIDDIELSIRVATMVRGTFPSVAIFARARNRQHEIALRDLGVEFVMRDTLASSLELAQSLLGSLGEAPDRAQRAIDMFRSHDAETLERQRAVAHDEEGYRQTTQQAADELRDRFDDDQRSSPADTKKSGQD